MRSVRLVVICSFIIVTIGDLSFVSVSPELGNHDLFVTDTVL